MNDPCGSTHDKNEEKKQEGASLMTQSACEISTTLRIAIKNSHLSLDRSGAHPGALTDIDAQGDDVI